MRYVFFFLLVLSNAFVQAQEPKLMLPIGHAASVRALRFSHTGKYLASASLDQSIKIWECYSGKLIFDLRSHEDYVSDVAFSPDDETLATSSSDGTIKLWSTKQGTLLKTFEGHTSWGFKSIAFSPGGDKLMSASLDGTISVWNISNGNRISVFMRDMQMQYAFYNSSGNRIVAFGKYMGGDMGDTTYVLDANAELVFQFPGKVPWQQGIVEKGKKIIINNDATINIYSLESGELLERLNINAIATDAFHVLTSDSANKLDTTIAYIYDRTIRNNDSLYIGGINIAIAAPNNNLIAGKTADDKIRFWDATILKQVDSLNKMNLTGTAARLLFNNQGTNLLSVNYRSGTVSLYRLIDGKKIVEISASDNLTSYQFSPDDKMLATSYADGKILLTNSLDGKLLASIGGHTAFTSGDLLITPDNKQMIISNENKIKIWESQRNYLNPDFQVTEKEVVRAIDLNPDGKLLLVQTRSAVKLFDRESMRLVKTFLPPVPVIKPLPHYVIDDQIPEFRLVVYDSGWVKIILLSYYSSTAEVRDIKTGNLLFKIVHRHEIKSIKFSENGNYIITAAEDSMVNVWNAKDGRLVIGIKLNTGSIQEALVSPKNKYISIKTSDSLILMSFETGKIVFRVSQKNYYFAKPKFTPDGSKFLYFERDTLWSFDVALKRKSVFNADIHSKYGNYNFQFSHSGKTIAIYSGSEILLSDNQLCLIDAGTGQIVHILKGHALDIYNVTFTPDDKQIITTSWDQTLKKWNAETGELLYTFFAVDSTDYLVVDKYNRYDGTEGARKLLYFTCGTEVISLDQVKDSLWVPNLAERIMKGEPINSPKLSDLNLCGLTPLIEQQEDASKNTYTFSVSPRRGGLGETVLSINGIEVKRYQPQQLLKKEISYQLQVSSAEVQPYFAAGAVNNITVKAYTANNSIASRGVTVLPDTVTLATARTPPNLYAIMVGVSDYKGTALDLQYAAKDAEDLSGAIAAAGGKLLGSQHVYMYNINTGSHRTGFPEKATIRQAFADIGKKATANDILLLFFAGHGVMEGQKKQFYFLTADASKDGDVAGTGISIAELTEWMKPANIRTQKRILIFDACNSGQAINDLITIGSPADKYIAVRNDEESNRIKAIEKLNERSGLLILSASASNQSAYELGRYNQGLLTYALLKAIKEQPEILDANRYLNVSKWFGAAEKTVTDIVRETGARQQPQTAGLGSFNIGLVDKEVIAGITLPVEKPLFTGSNFINLTAGDDDLDITKAVNNRLHDVAERGGNNGILYLTATNSPDAYSLTGTYEVKGEEVILKINIKQKGIIRHRLEVKGKITSLLLLAAEVWKGVEAWIKTSK